jgi:hypothetical protein
MSMKAGRPRSGGSRGKKVGPDYPAERFEIPWDAGLSGGVNSEFGSHESKTISSVNELTFAPDLPHLEGRYDELWDGK